MTLPYSDSTSGVKAMDDIQKILRGFGCQSFGYMTDYENGKLIVQFKYKEMPITVEASFKGYAAAWLKENPWTSRKKLNRQQYESEAMIKGQTATYSILRDWIKGQITAVECGILSFQGAFLGQILLPSGKTILQHAEENKLLRLEN